MTSLPSELSPMMILVLSVFVIVGILAYMVLKKTYTKVKVKIKPTKKTKLLYFKPTSFDILTCKDSPSSISSEKTFSKAKMWLKDKDTKSYRHSGDDYFIAKEGIPKLINAEVLVSGKLEVDEETLGKATNPKFLSAYMAARSRDIIECLLFMGCGVTVWFAIKWAVMVIWKVPSSSIPF